LDYPNIKTIVNWKDEHIDFISAMNLEKLAFSSFGFLIILLSSFTSFSIMCLMVIRRVPEIGILRTLGFSRCMIANIYIFQSFLIGIIGCSIGTIASKILIKLDNASNLIKQLVSSDIIFDFQLAIFNFEIFFIFIIGLFIMLLGGIYPSLYASKIPILKTLNYYK